MCGGGSRNKWKDEIIKIRSEINKIENKQNNKISKAKKRVFEKIYKIDKLQARWLKKHEGTKLSIPRQGNKRYHTNQADFKRIIQEYKKQPKTLKSPKATHPLKSKIFQMLTIY